jgi:preprotein translocase subunit SecG
VLVVLLTIIHVIVCFFLVVVVLLQSGKAADLAGAFGGMGSQTAFGPRGAATVLSKATTIAAGLFMITSLSLAIMATRNAGTAKSVLEGQKSTAKPGTAQTPPAGAQAPAGAGAQQAPAAPGGQPVVEITPEGGPTRTIPLDLDKLPRVDPSQAKPNSAPPAQQQQTPSPKK